MHLLDLSNCVLLDILSLVDPVDLVSIYNVCVRLRPLAERTINNAVLNLHFTGVKCFPNLKPRSIDNFDQIRVTKNWLGGKFRRIVIANNNSISGGIVLDEHLYVTDAGTIRKYDRVGNDEYLSSKFRVIGNLYQPVITKFAKKDNVIFTGCRNGTCMIYQDDMSAIARATVSSDPIQGIDLFPKNDIYVIACDESVQISIKRQNERTLLTVDEVAKISCCVKIDPVGGKLIMGPGDIFSSRPVDMGLLYDFTTMNKEDLFGLNGLRDLMWKDNQTFLSGHCDSSLRLFDLRTKSVCQRLDTRRKDNIVSIQFDGQNAVLCGFEHRGTANICDLRMKRVLRELNIFDEDQYPFLFQIVADPKHLFVVSSAGLQICDFSV